MVIAKGIAQGLHRIDQEISMELGYIAFYRVFFHWYPP